jgi:hypothetical protein
VANGGRIVKRFIPHVVLLVFAFAPAGAAWAQQDDLDVTMKVVPADASAGSALSEIRLPDMASDRARDAAASGLSAANKARDMKGELGRDFGQSVSEAAQNKNNALKGGVAKGKAP